jgi:hypothetical protein
MYQMIARKFRVEMTKFELRPQIFLRNAVDIEAAPSKAAPVKPQKMTERT